MPIPTFSGPAGKASSIPRPLVWFMGRYCQLRRGSVGSRIGYAAGSRRCLLETWAVLDQRDAPR